MTPTQPEWLSMSQGSSAPVAAAAPHHHHHHVFTVGHVIEAVLLILAVVLFLVARS